MIASFNSPILLIFKRLPHFAYSSKLFTYFSWFVYFNTLPLVCVNGNLNTIPFPFNRVKSNCFKSPELFGKSPII